MTSATRIVVTERDVHAALADWMAERQAVEREHGEQRSRADRDRCFDLTPGDYATDMAPYVFTLLAKHGKLA